MNQRLLSLDTFRGLTVAAMILVNNPGDWGHVYAPLLHAHWNGCTPTDLIFPFFLFIVGVSISFALANAQNEPKILRRVVYRGLVLMGLGLFLNLYPKFDFANFRIPGVLQRIGLVYIICSFIFIKTNVKTQIYAVAGLLILYYLLLHLVPVPGVGYANLQPETNLGAWLDRTLLGNHLYKATKVWDPEGLLGTIPAAATGLLGVLAGQLLRSKYAPAEKVAWLFLAGNALILSGLIVDSFFAINKSLWSSSYVLYAGGWAAVGLSACYWLIDVQGYQRWTRPFVVFGVNAITVFFMSGIIPRTLGLIKITTTDGSSVNLQLWLYKNAIAPFFGQQLQLASLAGALTFLGIWLVILNWMYNQKIIIKV
jgi:predicted acyltransferase